MNRMLLRALNAPGLVLLAAIGIAIQTSLFSWWPLTYFQPDAALLLVVWCALRRDFTEGGVLALVFAQIAELHSSVPQGVFLISYMLIYLLVRASARFFVIPDLASLVIVTLFASIIWKLENMIILNLLAPNLSQWRNTLFLLFPGAAAEGLISIWAYQGLTRFDVLTYRSKRSEGALEEEELQLDSEGF